MTICIVQPTATTKYIRLGMYNLATNQWEYRQTMIPVETEDTRFRDAVRMLSHGWMLFDTKGNPHKVSDALRAEIERDPPRTVDNKKIDFSGFWHRYNKQLDKDASLKAFKADPIKATIDRASSKLVARYKAGEKLPAYVLASIQKYL